MKKITIVIALVSAVLGFQHPASAAPEVPQGVAIEEVITQVKQALANAQAKLQEGTLPPLKAVKLSLQTVTEKKVGGGIKLLVISIGGSKERARTQQLDLVLVPPPPGVGANIAPESITSELENAIVAAGAGAKNAGAQPIPLKVSSLEVQLSFGVKASGSAGLSGIELGPIAVDLSGESAKASAQTLSVMYELK